MDKLESVQLKEAFDRDGVVVIRNFIAQKQIDEICERAEILTRRLPKRSDIFSNITKGLDKMDDYFNDQKIKLSITDSFYRTIFHDIP